MLLKCFSAPHHFSDGFHYTHGIHMAGLFVKHIFLFFRELYGLFQSRRRRRLLLQLRLYLQIQHTLLTDNLLRLFAALHKIHN